MILKKIVGVLKMLRTAIPVLTTTLGIVGVVQGANLVEDAKKNIEDAKLQISQTAIVTEIKEKDLEIYQSQYDSGAITASEFSEKQRYVESSQYVDDIIEMKGLEEQKAILKQVKNDADAKENWGYVLCSVSAIITAGGLGLMFYFYLTEEGRMQMEWWVDEGKEDFEYKEPKKEKEDEDTLEIKY